MVSAAIALAEVFGGIPQIGELVKNFDFSKINVKDNSRQDYLTVGLAPSFGELNKESIKNVDNELKVMIAGSIKTIASIPQSDRTWDKVVSAMMQCPLIEPAGDAITKTDKLIKSGTNVFKFDGSPDSAIVREVQAWFVNLISDNDIIRSTQIDIGVLGNIVAQTGATINSFETLFYKKEEHSKTLVDIGVLRFPDLKNPHFKLYRIQLTAWSKSERVLMVQEDHNGITGDFIYRKYQPRKEVIEKMSAHALETATNEADNMFP